MVVRRTARARLGAALLLAAACALIPTVAHTAPAPTEMAPMAGGICGPPQAFASAPEVEVGEPITITGECFPEGARGSINIIGPEGSLPPKPIETDLYRSFSATFPLGTPGEYNFAIDVQGVQDDVSLLVKPNDAEGPDEPEQPTDPEQPEVPEEPTEPEQPTDPEQPEVPEEPTEPEQPMDPEQPSEPEEPTTPEQPSAPGTPSEPEQPSDDDADNGDAQTPEATPAPATPTPTFASTDNDPAPSAAEAQPSTPAPSSPGPATNDFPSTAPEYTSQQRQTGSFALLMVSLFAHGVSGGEVGISPQEARADGDDSRNGGESGGGNASDGGDASDGGGEELAETGMELSATAAATALALFGGAGMLLIQRRRRD